MQTKSSDTNAPLLEGLKSKQKPENVAELELTCYWWEGKMAESLKKRLRGSYKVKEKPIMRPSNLIPRYLPKRNENIGSYKILNRNICNSLIQAGSTPHTLQLVHEWVNKMSSIHMKEHHSTIKALNYKSMEQHR